MIVVDTNVIHYCWVRGQNTEIAQAVREKDPEWHAPILWRSELRNVLTAYLRRGVLTRAQIVGILGAADRALAEREHIIPDDLVLDVVASSVLTAHDAGASENTEQQENRDRYGLHVLTPPVGVLPS